MAKKEVNFDELNSLDIYYLPMQIDIGSKARRRELAEYLTDAFLFFFSAFEVHKQFNQVLQKQLYQQLLADRVSDAVTKVTGIDSYMSNHIKEMSREVVDTTFKYANKDGVKPDTQAQVSPTNSANQYTNPNSNSFTRSTPIDEDPALLIHRSAKESSESPFPTDSSDDSSSLKQEPFYWLSYRRAEDIAKSEANTFLNYTDYVDAKESGATHKRWLTMLDDKVRQTHSEVEGQTIGIDEEFTVGNSRMRFPHDLESSPDPKEVIGCRCAVEYF